MADTVIHNNLAWKFNKELSYPKSIYRDEYSVVLRDKNTTYHFMDDFGSSDSDAYIRIHNSVQFTKKHVYPGTENAMTFFAKLGVNHQPFVVSIYALNIEDDSIEMTNIVDNEAISEQFSLLGDAICIALEKYVDEQRHEYESSYKEPERSFLDKLFNRKNNYHPYDNLKKNEFIKNVNLLDIVRPLIEKYVYDEFNNEDGFKNLSNLCVVISISKCESMNKDREKMAITDLAMKLAVSNNYPWITITTTEPAKPNEN